MPILATVEPRISLLYVDDEPALLEIARLFLERIGNYSVSTCDNPHDALKIISEGSFDAIISDYQMPDCDGISFLKYLRKNGNKTPFIIFTGKGREDVVIQALNEGADFYLQKGGDPKSQFAELSNKVRYAVTRKQAEEELEDEKAIMDAIFSSVPGMLYLYDSEGKLIRWNANHVLMTGYSPEELSGMQLLDWYKGDEESQAAVLEGISRTMKEGFGEAEANLQKKDGTNIPMYFTASPVTIHGRQYFTGIGIDISDKKEAESALLRKNEELSAAEEELRSQLEEIITIRDQLEESNEYLGNLITYANAPIIVWDQQCRITRFNDAFGRLTGIPPEQAIGSHLEVLFPQESRDISMDLIRRAMAGETWDVVEIPIRHRSGEVRTVLWNSANIRGNDGETIIATIAQGQDITDRKQAEMELLKKNEELRAAEEEMQAAYEELTATEEEIRSQLDENIAIQHQLALSEEQYRAIFEHTEAPTIIIEEDKTISLANSAFIELYGYTLEEIVGRNWTEFVSTSDLERMNAYHRQRREEGVETPPKQYVFTFINRYGDPRTIHLTIGLLPGTQQSVASFHDITELKQAEEALRESEEKYRLIADNTADNIWIFDMDFNLRYISPSVLTMKGFTVEESFAQTVEEKLTPTSYAALLDRFNEEMEREATGTADPDRNVSFETEEYCKDGSTIKVENSTRLLRDDEGRPVEILGISRDITDRKAAEEALQTANKNLQLLSSITRHDIMNKIMTLQAYLDLTMPMIDDPILTGYLTEAEKAATAIQKQIEFTKVYENLGVHTPTWQPLTPLIKAIHDTRLPIHYDCGEFTVYADPMFESVLHNLYDNTIRYAEGADCVRIRCEEKESNLIITWEDNGPGVPEEQKERIFDKSFGKNTGFGLFLTREILSITGITISETGVYGEGARFEIRVPAGGFLGT